MRMSKTRRRVLELAEELVLTARERYPMLGVHYVTGPYEGTWVVGIAAPDPIDLELNDEVFAFLLPRIHEIFDKERIDLGVAVVTERFAAAWAA